MLLFTRSHFQTKIYGRKITKTFKTHTNTIRKINGIIIILSCMSILSTVLVAETERGVTSIASLSASGEMTNSE